MDAKPIAASGYIWIPLEQDSARAQIVLVYVVEAIIV